VGPIFGKAFGRAYIDTQKETQNLKLSKKEFKNNSIKKVKKFFTVKNFL